MLFKKIQDANDRLMKRLYKMKLGVDCKDLKLTLKAPAFKAINEQVQNNS